MRLKIYIIWIVLGCVPIQDFYAQSYRKINLNLEGDHIDLISLEKDHVNLVTSNGVYDFDGMKARPILKVNTNTLLKPNQSYCNAAETYFFPLKEGGYFSLSKTANYSKLEYGDLNEGAIVSRSGGSRWLVNGSLYKYTNQKWLYINPIIKHASKPRDCVSTQDKIWVAYNKEGIACIENDNKVMLLSEKDGLLDNNPSSLSVHDTEIYSGHKGGISIISSKGIDAVDLKEYIGNKAIVELEFDSKDKMWFVTKDGLYSYSGAKVSKVKLDLESGEECLSMHIGKDENIWMLTNRSVYIVANSDLEKYSIVNESTLETPVIFYQIRGHEYYSDTKSVYKLDKAKKTWVKQKKKAPKSIVHDSNENPVLVFGNNKGVSIHKYNAGILYNISVPEDENLKSLDRIDGKSYYSTASNLYEVQHGNYRLINQQEDDFYKVVETINGPYAFSAHGVHEVEEDGLESMLASYRNTTYPPTNNQFVMDEILVTFTESSLHVINTNKESIQEIGMQPLQIFDIKESGSVVWLLCSKSLIAIDKSELRKGKINILKVIPLYETLKQGRLYQESEDMMWAISKDKILSINVEAQMGTQEPSLQVHSIVNESGEPLVANHENVYNVRPDDLPISISYNASNYWTDNINYTFHTNHDGKNTSEWRSENTYTLESDKAGGMYNISAKIKDDIHGTNIYAEPITINVEHDIVIGGRKGKQRRLPYFLISLLSLCLLLGLYRSRRYFL